ncbi:MAG: hypothetical protein OXG85_02075 [Chloroflexi bacterium]|nr:hypothetical protein [Chloroflexota bacterium]
MRKMLPQKLITDVMALEDGDKQELFWLLLKDPALKEIAPEVTGLRYNYEAAQILLEMLEEQKVKISPEGE